MSTPEEDRHLEIMVALGKIDTKFEDTVMPAVSQTYKNKDHIKSLQIRQGIGGSIMLLFVYTTVKGLISHFIKQPPPTH